jgi:quercetin dioxygenase-like cupin family protein
MNSRPGPYDGGTDTVIFQPSGAATVKTMSPTFYEEMEQEFPDFAGHMLIQRYAFTQPWPTWERHPKGDEYVYLLSGDADLVLWQDGQEIVTRVSEPGTYVIVPRDTWHTARPHKPTTMLFVTPGEGTENVEHPTSD